MGIVCLQYYLGSDQLYIGRSAVVAAQMAEEGKAPSKFWIIENADVLKMGRDEWKQ